MFASHLHTRPRRVALLIALSLLACVGCEKEGAPRAAEGHLIPKGRLLKNGLPIQVKEKENLPPGDPGFKITFIHIGGADAGTEIDATVSAEEPGTFALVGNEGHGIPPGKYRVVIHVGAEEGEDELKGKFSRENSKLDIEVKEGEDIVIDIANH